MPIANCQLNQSLLSRDVRHKLARLRRMLRRRLTAEGLAVLAMAVVAGVFITLGLDYLLRLDRPLRIGLSGAALVALAVVAWRGLIAPWRVPMDEDSLVLLVERRWPNLRDRLVTALQFGRQSVDPQQTSESMIAHTAEQANRLAGELDFGVLIERRALRRIGAASLCSLALLAGFAVWTSPAGTMGLWFKRNVVFTNDPWPQKTYLSVQGLRNPRVLRGDDLVVTVGVEDDSVAPDFVVFHADYPSVGATEERADLAGDGRSYEKKFQGVNEEFTFYVTGGDDSRDRDNPHKVTLIDPPSLREVEFAVEYPSYMNRPESPYEPVKGVLNVPLGGYVKIRGQANKDLQQAVILIDQEEAGSAKINPVTIGSDPVPHPRGILGRFAVVGPNRPAARALRIAMKDTEGYSSRGNQSFMIQVIPDLPPSVEIRTAGLNASDYWGNRQIQITPNAIIPLEIHARDDYAVAEVLAGIGLLTSTSRPASAPAASAPATGPAMLAAQVKPPADGWGKEGRAAHTMDLDLLGEKPRPGDTLTVFARASDTLPGNLGGPNVRDGTLDFRVISPEQMRAELTNRQKEISAEFAQAMRVQDSAIARTSAAKQGLADGIAAAQVRGDLAESSRSQLAVWSECTKSADQLGTILEAMINNRVFSQDEHSMLADDIIAPLRALSGPIKAASENLSKAGQLLESPRDDTRASLTEQVNLAAINQDKVLEQMKAIYQRMRKLESRQDIINQVMEISKVWNDISVKTKELEKKQVGNMFGPASRPATRP